MIIDKILIKRFRGFRNVEFKLGSSLTIIAGQNGTQKTTLLGILSQPFSITDKNNSLYGEKPLCGGSFKSAFAEKFKLSDKFDKPKEHEWSLILKKEEEPFTIESIDRNDKKNPNTIRFWRKGDRSKGSGYIQLPVIYLSLKRLLPIGEDIELEESQEISLTQDEATFYQDWHNKILIVQEKVNETNYLTSNQKNTLGVTTDLYDWKQNSAGQDNIGKILLAILSFKRLKDKAPDTYKGGILAIDEVDATLFPASQIKLLGAFRNFSAKYNIQIILTTHSLTVLEDACIFQGKCKIQGQTKVVFLEKKNKKVEVIENITFESIRHKLNVTIGVSKDIKIPVFTEDREGEIFLKALLKRRITNLKFYNCKFGYSNLIELAQKKTPGFVFPNSIIFLDGDVSAIPRITGKLRKLKNFLILPGNDSPERLLATFLFDLNDDSPVWSNINDNFTKQYCFKDITYDEIKNPSQRKKAKEWFNSHIKIWGRNATKVINPWISVNEEIVDSFIHDFINIYNKMAKEHSFDTITQ